MDGTVDCPEVLLRGIQWKHLDWDPVAEEVVFLSNAFMLRRRHDGVAEEYLSVDRTALSTVDESFARWGRQFRKGMPAARTLHSGKVRALGLSVDPRPLPDNPAHAGVAGLPAPPEPGAAVNESGTAVSAAAVALQQMSRLARFDSPAVIAKVRQKFESRR